MNHFDAIAYCRDLGIRTWTEGKNCRGKGWVNIRCPLACGDKTNHGQFAPPGHPGAPYICWKCRGHSLEAVVQALERVDYLTACRRVKQYQVANPVIIPRARTKPTGKLKLPTGTAAIGPAHRKYLEGRGFDPELLERKYGLLGTGPAGSLPHRIVAPIFFRGCMVSWQARDITGRAELRYISASPADEEMPHKETLYNIDNCRGRAVIVVEGITDVWLLGDDCLATFGTKFTKAQVLLLAMYRQVFVVYDGEPEAQRQARRLCRILSGLGVVAANILLDGGDPGDMGQDEAQRLKSELIGG